MDLMTRVIRRLIPLRIGAKFRAVVDAIAASVETLYQTIRAIVTEANPGTAEDTLEQWYEMLGLRYDSTLRLATRQALARQGYVSIGGQSLADLNAAIQVAFPDVEIEPVRVEETSVVGVAMVGRMEVTDYPSWYSGSTDGTYPIAYYRVTGEVNDAAERTALLNLLDRIAPAEMEPNTGSLVIRNQTETAEVGLAMVGLAQVGRTKEDA
jgi:phage tail protein X